MYPSRSFFHKGEVIANLLNKLWGIDGLFEPYNRFDLVLGLGRTRGHFVHQFEVFLLGLNIIELAKDNVLGICKAKGYESYPDIVKTWVKTATAHDFGYPLEAASKISKTLSDLYLDIGMTDISNGYKQLKFSNHFAPMRFSLQRIFRRMVKPTEIEQYIHEGINDAIDLDCNKLINQMRQTVSHGYASAFIACNKLFNHHSSFGSLDAFVNSNDGRHFRDAVSAIAIHSIDYTDNEYRDYILSLNPANNIFAYLLFIVDNLQDWDRTVIDDGELADFRLNNFEVENKEIKIGYLVTHRSWESGVQERVKNFIAKKEQIFKLVNNSVLDVTIKLTFESNDGATLYRERSVQL